MRSRMKLDLPIAALAAGLLVTGLGGTAYATLAGPATAGVAEQLPPPTGTPPLPPVAVPAAPQPDPCSALPTPTLAVPDPGARSTPTPYDLPPVAGGPSAPGALSGPTSTPSVPAPASPPAANTGGQFQQPTASLPTPTPANPCVTPSQLPGPGVPGGLQPSISVPPPVSAPPADEPAGGAATSTTQPVG